MNRQICAAVLAGILLCAGSALAYDGGGYTIDVPAEWGQEQTFDNMTYWYLTDGSNVGIQVLENEEGANPFDLDDEAVSEIDSEIVDGLIEELETQFAAEPTLAGITPVLASGESGIQTLGAQPYFTYHCQVNLEMQGQTLGSLYMYEAMFMAKEHTFTIAATASDAASAQNLLEQSLNSFTITEEVFTKKTPGLFSDVLRNCIVGGLVGLVGGGIWASIVFRKRKKDEAPPDDPHLLPPNL